MRRSRIHWKQAGVLVVLLLLAWSTSALADQSIRCDGKIISLGASKDQVLKLCGKPDHLKRWEVSPNSVIAEYYDYAQGRYKLPKVVVGPLHMERWTYDLGSTRLIRHLLFQDGELIRIETGESGSN